MVIVDGNGCLHQLVWKLVNTYRRKTPPNNDAFKHSGGESLLWTSAMVTLYFDVLDSKLNRPGTEQNTSLGEPTLRLFGSFPLFIARTILFKHHRILFIEILIIIFFVSFFTNLVITNYIDNSKLMTCIFYDKLTNAYKNWATKIEHSDNLHLFHFFHLLWYGRANDCIFFVKI